MDKIDRIFVSTEWDKGFPLARVKSLDYQVIITLWVLEAGVNAFFW